MSHEIVESETIYLKDYLPFLVTATSQLATKTNAADASKMSPEAKRLKSGPVAVVFDSRKYLGTLDWIHEDNLVLHPPTHGIRQRLNLPKSKQQKNSENSFCLRLEGQVDELYLGKRLAKLQKREIPKKPEFPSSLSTNLSTIQRTTSHWNQNCDNR